MAVMYQSLSQVVSDPAGSRNAQMIEAITPSFRKLTEFFASCDKGLKPVLFHFIHIEDI